MNLAEYFMGIDDANTIELVEILLNGTLRKNQNNLPVRILWLNLIAKRKDFRLLKEEYQKIYYIYWRIKINFDDEIYKKDLGEARLNCRSG
jgi:hypothetical protein